MGVDKNLYLTGTNGDVWINGKLLANLKKIEMKVTGEFEEVKICGDYGTKNVYVGWSGEGSCTLQKVDSEVLSLMGQAYASGIMPEIKIVTKLTNKSTKKTERTAISQVDFTEFPLANFESHGLIEEEIPFKFAEYEILETILN